MEDGPWTTDYGRIRQTIDDGQQTTDDRLQAFEHFKQLKNLER
jgi:hypothetical protein